jgi:NAD(P)-dependent dehydrogenase (short-subunit alcohol dehydrogenase family)
VDLGLAGRVALITGGSAGIGRACAAALAREGVDVAICARSAARLEDAAALVRGAATGRRVLAVAADLTQPEQIAALVDRVERELGGIDILVNNAGASRFGDPLEIDDAAWVEAMTLKYLGYVRCARAVAPRMIARGWGRIVNVIGTAGKRANPVHLPGGASNAALVLFTKGFGLQLAPHGVLVNAVSPAGVATDRLARLAASLAEQQGVSLDEAWRRMAANSPLGRPARPEEVADAVCFLASERATYFVGTTLWMDGGELNSV